MGWHGRYAERANNMWRDIERAVLIAPKKLRLYAVDA